MKIAMLAPSPIPYIIGGAENLAWNVCENLNQKSPHQVELIKVPVREDNFWNIIDAYYKFYSLDLSHFDAIICSKYPAWMIRHPNCMYYVLHRLRGLYDTYELTGQPIKTQQGIDRYVDEIIQYMEQIPNPVDLDVFFELIFDMRDNVDDVPVEFFTFPGPFIRKIVHYMDNFGMSQNQPSYYYAISKTVKNRAEYFPKDAKVKVIYPPVGLQNYKTGGYKHLFIVSRLHHAKRIDLLIEAMKLVKSDIKLYIAGTGPQEAKLREMAKDDPRITFLGFVTDQEVDEYYANSLVVPYFPEEEDYGLITIEAMKHKKPVITTRDAGGPTEFVVSGETGFIVDIIPEKIAEKIDYFAQNPALAQKMGEKAFAKVGAINWDNAVEDFAEALETQQISLQGLRKKVTVTATFPVWPPIGGGQARIFGLYSALAQQYDVDIVSVTKDVHGRGGEISKNLREFSVYHGSEMAVMMAEYKMLLGVPANDIGMLKFKDKFPSYLHQLRRSFTNTDWVVVSEPYSWELVKQVIGEIPFVYEALNVESALKEVIIPEGPYKEEAIQLVFEAEKECCKRSAFITACSQEDKEKLAELYGIPLDKIMIVPNGVDTRKTKYVQPEHRRLNKLKMGLGGEKIALFMGSMHGPNLEAAEEVIRIAPQCPNTKFMLLGSQCGYFKYRKMPKNVALLGRVNEKQKKTVFSTVDIALNPMHSGSGTNLKMFDYMAAGLPVITTTFGARGIDRKEVFTIADTEQELVTAIKEFDIVKPNPAAAAARKYVEETFDWNAIVKPMEEKMSSIL